MEPALKPKVKICCIGSTEEASLAISSGATAVGLVSHMPSGPGIIRDDVIKEILPTIPPGISSFLLTSLTKVDEIICQLNELKANTIQIVDRLEKGSYQMIKDEFPEVDIVQVIHVVDERSVEEAIKVSMDVDYILLDSGNPNLETKILGGTGKVHNWEISKVIREEVDVPIYLAGGLSSENVKAACEFVRPYGVDLCSGVRTNGMLDLQKLMAFFDSVGQIGL